ncbi:MAG: DinB family protein [Candidatus Aminicenantes bacterium]|jgi:uncharacterized damage-inducible protein DinB
MFISIEQFKQEWQAESDNTRKIFSTLTDESLKQSITEGHRTLGRIAWHIVQSLADIGRRTGLKVEGPAEDVPVPLSAEQIKQAYDTAAKSLLEQVTKNWTDETLDREVDMYGQKWNRGLSLYILLKHESHHRGQMTVLMRQAGLKVPGTRGPAKEEYSQYGAEPPQI